MSAAWARSVATVSMSSAAAWATAIPATWDGRPARASPTRRPACVPPVAVGRTTTSGQIPRAAAWSASSRPARIEPTMPTGPDPPVGMTYGRWPAPRSSSTTRSTVALRSSREAVAVTWTVAPSSSSRRSFGPGSSAGGPVSTRWTPRPAFAPAAAVSRAWLDQRRPVVTSVSAPSASAAPTRNSRLRSLLPPKASGSRSSRLIQTSTPPPIAAAKRGRCWSGDGPSRRANRGRSGIQRAAMLPMVRGRYHRRPSTPAPQRRPHPRGGAPAWPPG